MLCLSTLLVAISSLSGSVVDAWIVPTSPSLAQTLQRRRGTPRSASESRWTNQQTQQDMIQFMEQKPTAATITAADLIVDDATMDLVHIICAAADGRKADQIVAWVVQHVTTLTSVVVVVSGNSRPQNQAIGNAIRQAVVDAQILPSSAVPVEGTAESGWMVLDYGSVMVHIMTPKSRLFYNVEGQWKDTAVSIDLSSILVPNSASVANFSAPPAPTPEEDPFWS